MQATHAILKFSRSYITKGKSRGAWVAQAVGRLTLGIDSGLGLEVMGLGSHLGPCAGGWGREPT